MFFFPGDSLQKIDQIIDETSQKNNSISDEQNDRDKLATPIDWKPQENCYFCVDGKLLTVNDKGDLVAESGSVNTEPDLANRVSIYVIVCIEADTFFFPARFKELRRIEEQK